MSTKLTDLNYLKSPNSDYKNFKLLSRNDSTVIISIATVYWKEFPAGVVFVCKDNHGNTRPACEICLKLTIKIPE